MAFVVKDRVKETCTAPGTGTVTLLGASSGYQDFSAIGNGNTTYYCIADQGGNNWEVGVGVYTASGTTLSRDTVLSSSNGGSKTNFSTGTQDVFVTYPSSRSVYVNSGGSAITPDVASTLATTNGGTGQSTYTAGDLFYYATGTAFTKLGIGSNKTILTSTGTAPQWSASIDISQGGTGVTSYTAGDITYYSAGTAFTKLGIGSAGTVLTSTGSAPQWSAATSVAVTSISFGSTGLTPSTATQGVVTVAGTLATTNGGTGLTSFTANRVFFASSTSAIGSSASFTFDGTSLTAPIVNASNGILVNSTTMTTSYTIATGTNGLSVGPFTINSGVILTIDSGQRHLIL